MPIPIQMKTGAKDEVSEARLVRVIIVIYHLHL